MSAKRRDSRHSRSSAMKISIVEVDARRRELRARRVRCATLRKGQSIRTITRLSSVAAVAARSAILSAFRGPHRDRRSCFYLKFLSVPITRRARRLRVMSTWKSVVLFAPLAVATALAACGGGSSETPPRLTRVLLLQRPLLPRKPLRLRLLLRSPRRRRLPQRRRSPLRRPRRLPLRHRRRRPSPPRPTRRRPLRRRRRSKFHRRAAYVARRASRRN